MASVRAHLVAVAAFGVGMWVAQILPAAAVHIFSNPMPGAQWQLLLEVSALTTLAAAAGFAVVRCKSVLLALCAVPIAELLMFLIPSRIGVWLSESFHSVAVNAVVVALIFVVASAVAGWSVCRFFNRYVGHA